MPGAGLAGIAGRHRPIGAVVVDAAGTIIASGRYPGADPRHGGTWALTSQMYAVRQEVQIAGPRDDQVGLLASGLTFAYHWRRSVTSAFARACQELRPDIAAAGAGLTRAGLVAMAERRMAWAAAAPALLAAV